MKKETNIHLDLKRENRNKVFNKIRSAGRISSTDLAYELQLSRPTIKQNLDDLLSMGYIYENGFFGHTGGRKAKAYSIAEKSNVAIGIDLTKNHVTVIIVDLCGNIIYRNKVRAAFCLEDSYMKRLGELTHEAAQSQGIGDDCILGVGIAVPGLITADSQKIFYGEILGVSDVPVDEIGKYIPYPYRLYNDASAAGYAEISQNEDLTNAFYLCLSNNVGGSVLIDHKVYNGETPRSGEIGHTTIIPDGQRCYCGQRGCFETYCNQSVLSGLYDGDLASFFEHLDAKDPVCIDVWQDYLKYLSIAVNNLRMLFDCTVILGGYVGAYLEKYLPDIKEMAVKRNSFENNADYLRVCKVKKEALALGSALPFIHEFWSNL